jgi:two-component system sensor histidine kinase AtoS
MNRMAGRRSSPPAIAQRPSRARTRLFVLLPLVMGLLVGATGYFATGMSRRIHVMHGVFSPETERLLRQLDVQLVMVGIIAAVLAFGMTFGVTTPLRALADRLDAVTSGDLRAPLDPRATPDAEWLAGAFNDALSSVNRYLLQGMSGAILSLSPDGLIIGSSPAAEMILGYREDELVGRRFSEAFAPPGSGRADLAAFESAIAERRPVNVDDAFIGTRDGRRIRVGLSVSYLRHADRPGEAGGAVQPRDVVGVTIGFKDLTEIRRLRDHLRKTDQLVALGTLTAGVAHELRNPLASMRGLTELLARDFAPDDARARYASTMLDSIDRLNTLVENLLLLSSDVTHTGEAVDVRELVREVTTFVSLGLGGRHVEIAIGEADVTPAARVLGSRNRLIQALSNIVLNAVQSTPDGGRVTVGVAPGDAHVAIRVHNTGSYIQPDVMKRLFVPFFTTRPSGTGLGLAIARQIVAAHHGQLSVESDRASGTCFIIELPAAGTASAAPADASLTATA